MTNNFKMIAVIIIGIILLFIFRMQNSDYNLNRTISACVAAQQQTSETFNYEKAQKYCEEKRLVSIIFFNLVTLPPSSSIKIG